MAQCHAPAVFRAQTKLLFSTVWQMAQLSSVLQAPQIQLQKSQTSQNYYNVQWSTPRDVILFVIGCAVTVLMAC